MVSIGHKEVAGVVHAYATNVPEASDAADAVGSAGGPAEAAQSGDDSAGCHFANREVILVGNIEVIIGTERDASLLVEPRATSRAIRASARSRAAGDGGYEVAVKV